MTASRRISRRRLRLLLERLQAPRAAWRSLVILPLIFMLTLMGMQGSAAWFTSAANAPGSFGSGSWASLMEPDFYSNFSFGGLIWDGYSGSVTVTSSAAVPLPITATATAGGPVVTQSDSTIQPGQTITVNLSGTYTKNWDGSLEIAIGENRFDWVTIPITIEPKPRDLSSIITVVTFGPNFCSKSGFDNQKLMTLSWPANPAAINVQVSLSQHNNKPPKADHDLTVSLVSPTGGHFSTTPGVAGSLDVLVSQPDVEKQNPTSLTVTLTTTSAFVTGTVTKTFTLAHESSGLCGPPGGGCENHPDTSTSTFGGGGSGGGGGDCGCENSGGSSSTTGGDGGGKNCGCEKSGGSSSTTGGDGGGKNCGCENSGGSSSTTGGDGGGGNCGCQNSGDSSSTTGGNNCGDTLGSKKDSPAPKPGETQQTPAPKQSGAVPGKGSTRP